MNMPQYIDLKTSHGVGYSRMGCRLTERTSSLQDATSLCSNHIKRSTRLYSTMIKGSDNIAKFKNLTNISSFGPSIDQQNRLPGQAKQPLPQKRTITKRVDVKVKTNFSKCPRKQVEMADAQFTPRSLGIHELPSSLEDANSATLQKPSEDETGVLETCSAMLSKGTRKLIKQRSGSESFHAPTISSRLRLIASRDAKNAIKSCYQGAGAVEKKCNLKKNRSSISEVVPCRRDAIASKIYLEGESSASRTNSTFVSSNRKLSGSQNTRVSTSTMLKASRMANRSQINDLLVVVKPLEHSRRGTTRGLPGKGSPHLSLREAMVAQMPATEFFSLGASGSSSRSLDNELSSSCHNVSGRTSFSGRNAPSRTSSNSALGSMITLCDPSSNTDAQSCNDTEGTVEPPMIVERIEHNQALTYEHLVESESNLSLGRFNYHDQHREMRMDIDNMSYEELLELVEKIGSVSTGLSDEALAKCLKRSNFKLAHSPFGITDCVENGNRCSICQEECVEDEDIGALACEHWYHAVCIQEWLKQKNSCPICKSPACANS